MSELHSHLKTYVRHLFSGTALSRVTGLLREVLLAFAFGTQGALAAFFIAYRFAHLFRRLFGEGALQNAFIPNYQSLKEDDPAAAKGFYQAIKKKLTLVLLAVIFSGECTLLVLLNWIDWSPDNAQIIKLTMWMLPSLLFICLYGLDAAKNQCEERYFLSAAAPALFNSVWILAILFSLRLSIDQAVIFLSLAIVIASLMQWVCCLRRDRVVASPFKGNVNQLIGSLGLGVMGVAATQINSALDSVFARTADLQGPAYLWFAIRMQQLPLSLVALSLSGALLPSLSKAVKQGERSQIDSMALFGVRQAFFFMVPITFFILFCGGESMALLYGRGDFDTRSAMGTYYCLISYGLGLFPMTLILILAPVCYAHGDYRTPTQGVGLAVCGNIFLNSIAVYLLDLGAYSVAAATSISACINALWLVRGLKMRYALSVSDYLWNKEQGWIALIGFSASFAAGWASYVLLGSNAFFSWIIEGSPRFTWGVAAQLGAFGVTFTLFTLLFFGIAIAKKNSLRLSSVL